MHNMACVGEPDSINACGYANAKQVADHEAIPEGQGFSVERDASKAHDECFGRPHNEQAKTIAAGGEGDGYGIKGPPGKARAYISQKTGYRKSPEPHAQFFDVEVEYCRAFYIGDQAHEMVPVAQIERTVHSAVHVAAIQRIGSGCDTARDVGDGDDGPDHGVSLEVVAQHAKVVGDRHGGGEANGHAGKAIAVDHPDCGECAGRHVGRAAHLHPHIAAFIGSQSARASGG